MTREWFSRRFIVFVAVLALHCLFLLLLWTREPIARKVAYVEPTSVLFFIETPRARVTPAAPVPTPSVPTTPTVITAEPNAAEQTSSAPEPSTSPATIDWNAQATEAAAAIVDKAIQDDKRKCDPSDSPKSFLPPCHHKTKKFDWAEPRAGFSGGLPYVRLGERCAIGLGFFGCAFGKRPPANGDLFEGMDDPERDRSSVPSTDPVPAAER
jgi:hypothetical protein